MKKPKKNLPKGKPLIPNAGIARWYARTLKAYVKAMTKLIKPRIIEAMKQKSLSTSFAMDEDVDDIITFLNNAQNSSEEIFSNLAIEIAPQFMERAEKQAETNIAKSISSVYSEFAITGTPITEALQNTIAASIAENVDLIKSIPSEYFKQIIGMVMRTITGEGTFHDLPKAIFKDVMKELNKIDRKAERRAELIAQDQTRKAFASINLRKMEAAGIKKFIWLHVGGGKTYRPWHRDVLNGQICDIDNPPVIDPRTGQKGFPAELPYCRCVMQPIITEEEE